MNKLPQISTKSYSVQDVVNCVCTLRKHNKDSFLSSFVQNMLHFVLQHPIDTQICEWFIQVVDSVPPQTFQLLDYITPSLYKDYLLHILGIHDGTKDENDLLELFQPMVCLFGAYILISKLIHSQMYHSNIHISFR